MAAERWRSRLVALLIAAVLALAHLALWWALNRPLPAPDVAGPVGGLALSAYQRWQQPGDGERPSDASLESDLALLAGVTPRVRSYSTLEMPQLPALAERHGLRLALGAWLGPDRARNERELALAIAAARSHRSVERLIVGNETQLHRRLSEADLTRELDRVRREANLPVSTAEPWHVWLQQPALADHVDFITVHLLPYWEKVPVERAVDVALGRYRQVVDRFPGKPVVIGEVGWPGRGITQGAAVADPAAQARFVRGFLARAQALQLDYYLMEAIDQPWKTTIEGRAGAHWGLFDAYREPKFALAGPVERDPWWRNKAVPSVLLGLLFTLPFLLKFSHLGLRARLAFGSVAHGIAAGTVLMVTLPLVDYLRPLDIAVWLGLMPALALIALLLAAQAFEFAELYWPGGLRRCAAPRPAPAGATLPPVSVHIACSNEPPAMVIATLQGVLALDWPALEVCVVDNNTADPALWRPVAAFVESLGTVWPDAHVLHSVEGEGLRIEVKAGERRICFLHRPWLTGFKAGALNLALDETGDAAAWVAVVDADYQVQPDWLRSLAGHLLDPAIDIVQSPQAHRSDPARPLERLMNAEYDGFFRIGMHHRHERNAIIQHGTMTLVRAARLRTLGGWETRCICEDTELGLRVLEAGGRALYVDRVAGTGLPPADSVSYFRQRRRWACGAMQILKLHAKDLLRAGRGRLTRGQRYHFLAGWLPWWGDTLHLLFSVAAVGWTLAVIGAPSLFGLPDLLFLLPIAAFSLWRLLLGPLLHARRVGGGWREIAGAALAGMALSHVIARGVLAGLFGRNARFEITQKAGGTPSARSSLFRHADSVRQEALLLAALAACQWLLARAAPSLPAEQTSLLGWQAVLAVQSLPYLAALALAAISWRSAVRRPATPHTAHSASPAAPTPSPSAPPAPRGQAPRD